MKILNVSKMFIKCFLFSHETTTQERDNLETRTRNTNNLETTTSNTNNLETRTRNTNNNLETLIIDTKQQSRN